MRIRPKLIQGIFLTLSIVLWIVVGIYHFYFKLIDHVFEGRYGDFPFEYRLFFTLFLASTALYIGIRFNRIERLDVVTLLWRLFIIGIGGISIWIFLILGKTGLENFNIAPYLSPILYSITLFVRLVFFLFATFIFRRFILYQRTRRKLHSWNIFLVLLGLSLVFNFIDLSVPAGNYSLLGLSLLFGILCIYLSTNVRWIAYLDFNKKLRTLGLFALIILVCITLIFADSRVAEILDFDPDSIVSNVFLNFLIAFVIIYSGISILVLFFNLPTSSIFELKSLEIASFQKINQAIQSNLDFHEIIKSLLDASVMAANAKGAWIEMFDESSGEINISQRHEMNDEAIRNLVQGNELTEKVSTDQRPFLVKSIRLNRTFRSELTPFRSLLVVPISSKNHSFGALYLTNNVAYSFEEVIVESITAFAEQAGMALENAKLIKNSIELERYQEQLKIAKEVQTQLLPGDMPSHDGVSIAAISENAQEVGGDYYDVLVSDDSVFKLAIGDVSGKGTTAAFYMAEIKGIFHALSLMDLSVKEFICLANKALANCMKKGLFITLTYLQIDTKKKNLELLRAGHCPSYYYTAAEDKLEQMREGTLGLGILRNDTFHKMAGEPVSVTYQPGDFIVLYTDGIQEARNDQDEEFGYSRIAAIIEENKHSTAEVMASEIVEAAKKFSDHTIEDDYTVLVIRFEE